MPWGQPFTERLWEAVYTQLWVITYYCSLDSDFILCHVFSIYSWGLSLISTSSVFTSMKIWMSSSSILVQLKHVRQVRKLTTLATTQRSSSWDKTAALWYCWYRSAPKPPWGSQSAGAKLTASAQFKPEKTREQKISSSASNSLKETKASF